MTLSKSAEQRNNLILVSSLKWVKHDWTILVTWASEKLHLGCEPLCKPNQKGHQTTGEVAHAGGVIANMRYNELFWLGVI